MTVTITKFDSACPKCGTPIHVEFDSPAERASDRLDVERLRAVVKAAYLFVRYRAGEVRIYDEYWYDLTDALREIPLSIYGDATPESAAERASGRLDVEALHRAVCLSGWVGRGQMDAWHRGPEGEWPCHDILARLTGGQDDE